MWAAAKYEPVPQPISQKLDELNIEVFSPPTWRAGTATFDPP